MTLPELYARIESKGIEVRLNPAVRRMVTEAAVIQVHQITSRTIAVAGRMKGAKPRDCAAPKGRGGGGV